MNYDEFNFRYDSEFEPLEFGMIGQEGHVEPLDLSFENLAPKIELPYNSVHRCRGLNFQKESIGPR